jgi:hypothetical protein
VTETSRQIVKSQARGVTEIQEALSALLSGELVDPSTSLYIHSAWITDVPLIDNTAGTFDTGGDHWEERWIYLVEVFVALMSRGTKIYLKTNRDRHNDAFIERLQSKARLAGVENRLRWRQEDDMHTKGLVGDRFALRGSMNLTYRGLNKTEETVDIDVDNADVSNLRVEFVNEWQGESGA